MLIELFFGVFLVFFGIFLFIFHKNNKKKINLIENLKNQYQLKVYELQDFINKRSLLEDKLDNKQTELIDFALIIVQKNEFLENLKFQINEIKNFSTDTKTVKKLNDLSLSINQHIAIDKNRKSFQLQLEEANQDFYNRLTQKFPNLTDKEKRLAAYLRLKLNSKEIASLLNITDKSVDMNRYRLRKKMAIAANENLTEFILTI
jgi:DNA-binding CsgD family transcriptional regulator